MASVTIRPEGDITRDLGSLLSRGEKRLLVRMAQGMPRPINSDHLTALGLLGMFGAGACFLMSTAAPAWLFGVVACLWLNWFGDSLDGTLARVRGHERPKYGYYVDHVVDVLGALFLLGGLGASPFMSWHVAAALMIAYYMVSAEIYLAAHAVGKFRIHFAGWGPTELRILLAAGVIAAYFKPEVHVLGSPFLLFDVGGAVATVGMAVVFLVNTLRNGIELYRREPLP